MGVVWAREVRRAVSGVACGARRSRGVRVACWRYMNGTCGSVEAREVICVGRASRGVSAGYV